MKKTLERPTSSAGVAFAATTISIVMNLIVNGLALLTKHFDPSFDDSGRILASLVCFVGVWVIVWADFGIEEAPLKRAYEAAIIAAKLKRQRLHFRRIQRLRSIADTVELLSEILAHDQRRIGKWRKKSRYSQKE